MKILFSLIFAVTIWILSFKFFFGNFEKTRKTAGNNLFWTVFDSVFNYSAHKFVIRLLIFLTVGILAGALFYLTL